METYSINLKNKVNELKELTINKIEYDGDVIILTIGDNYHSNLEIGQTIYYIRYIENSDKKLETISRAGRILDKYSDKIVVSLPFNEFFSVMEVNKTYDNKTRIKVHKQHNIFQQDLEYCYGQTIYLYDENRELIKSLEFSNNEYCIPLKYSDRQITRRDCLLENGKTDYCIDSECECGVRGVYDYIFLPENASRDCILISEKIPYEELEAVKYISFKYTPLLCEVDGKYGFYEDIWSDNFMDISDQCLTYNSGKSRTCICIYDGYYNIDLGISSDADEVSLGVEDSFGESFINELADGFTPDIIDMEKLKYIPAYKIGDNDDYTTRYYIWSSPYGTSMCDDENKVYTKEMLTDVGYIGLDDCKVYYLDEHGKMENNYSNKPNISNYYFDYEIVNGKEIPTLYKKFNDGSGCKYYFSEIIYGGINNITGITFYLHFREREKIKDSDRTSKNSVYTSGNVYYDTWHISQDDREFTWWNGYDVGTALNKEKFEPKTFKTFHNSNGKRSDLIGYLNFTDNDIFYRKKRVGNSFLRLLFYTSKDPIDQKLLYYSTIFFNDGELYGKYLKLLNFLNKNNTIKKNTKNSYNENAFLVNYDSSDCDKRIDSKITITNEYDKTGSSEGFNLYLFSDDKNFSFENGEKTIYMRVEFNHAGNGKTIPMIMWPKDSNGDFCPLTTENYIDSLYIPVKLMYIKNKENESGRYVYLFENCDITNDNLDLILYEPKLDMISDISDNEAPNDVSIIHAVPDNIIYSINGGGNKFTIISNRPWTAYTITNGLNISNLSGESGNTIISIVDTPTESFNEIVFKTIGGNGVGYETVNVLKTENFKPYLKLSSENIELSIIEPLSYTIKVISNTKWTINGLEDNFKSLVTFDESSITISVPSGNDFYVGKMFKFNVETILEDGFINRSVVKTVNVNITDSYPDPNVFVLRYINNTRNSRYIPDSAISYGQMLDGSIVTDELLVFSGSEIVLYNELKYDSVPVLNVSFDGNCHYEIKVTEIEDGNNTTKYFTEKLPKFDFNNIKRIWSATTIIDLLKYDINKDNREAVIEITEFEFDFGDIFIGVPGTISNPELEDFSCTYYIEGDDENTPLRITKNIAKISDESNTRFDGAVLDPIDIQNIYNRFNGVKKNIKITLKFVKFSLTSNDLGDNVNTNVENYLYGDSLDQSSCQLNVILKPNIGFECKGIECSNVYYPCSLDCNYEIVEGDCIIDKIEPPKEYTINIDLDYIISARTYSNSKIYLIDNGVWN